MRRDFGEETALKIMNDKLRGKSREAVYELSNAELTVLRDNLENWTVGMSQVLANAVGDLDETQSIIRDTIKLPEPERVKLAESAAATLDRGEVPPHQEFAAYILANNSNQLHIEDEIKRRESLQ
jgi:hypothetical protein